MRSRVRDVAVVSPQKRAAHSVRPSIPEVSVIVASGGPSYWAALGLLDDAMALRPRQGWWGECIWIGMCGTMVFVEMRGIGTENGDVGGREEEGEEDAEDDEEEEEAVERAVEDDGEGQRRDKRGRGHESEGDRAAHLRTEARFPSPSITRPNKESAKLTQIKRQSALRNKIQ